MSPITSVSGLPRERIQAFGFSYREATRINALANYKIKISEGALEMTRENRSVKALFLDLIFNKQLEQKGANLDQPDLEKLLSEAAFGSPVLSATLVDKDIPDSAPWSQISRGLELDAGLTVTHEDGYAIIALQDEVDAAAGESALAVSQGGALVRFGVGPGSSLALTDVGQDVMLEVRSQQVRAVIEKQIALSSTQDENVFLEAMAYLGLFMRGTEADRQAFVAAVMDRFLDFGLAVRAKIVKELLHFGLDEDLAEAIETFSSAASPAQRKEAINDLVARVVSADNELELSVGVLTLCKYLEEAASSGSEPRAVVMQAARKLSEVYEIVGGRPINNLKPKKILRVVKKLFESDPTAYVAIVGIIFVAIGQTQPAEVSALIRQKLAAAESPELKVYYLWILQQVEKEDAAKNHVFKERLDLFLEIGGKTREGKLLLAQLAGQLAETVEGIDREFDSYNQEQKEKLIDLLDELYPSGGRMDNIDSRFIVTDRFVRIVQGQNERLLLSVLQTKVVFDPAEIDQTGLFAPAILTWIDALWSGEFKERMLANPGIYLADLAAAAERGTSLNKKMLMLEIAIAKARKLTGDISAYHDSIQALERAAISLFREELGNESGKPFVMIGSLAAVEGRSDTEIANAYEILAEGFEYRLMADGQVPDRVRSVLPGLSKFASREAPFPRGILPRITQDLKKWAELLLPEVPGKTGALEPVDSEDKLILFKAAIDGLVSLFSGAKLDVKAQDLIVSFIIPKIITRKQPAAATKPDPARDIMIEALEKIDGCPNTDRSIRARIAEAQGNF